MKYPPAIRAVKFVDRGMTRTVYRASVNGKRVLLGYDPEKAKIRLEQYLLTHPPKTRKGKKTHKELPSLPGTTGSACCEPFSNTHVLPGYICCQCRHFNAWAMQQCWKCAHVYKDRPAPPEEHKFENPQDAMKQRIHDELNSK